MGEVETGETISILSVRPDTIASCVAPAPDNRRVYFAREMADADVWLLTLE
jgi:hypothetical protein